MNLPSIMSAMKAKSTTTAKRLLTKTITPSKRNWWPGDPLINGYNKTHKNEEDSWGKTSDFLGFKSSPFLNVRFSWLKTKSRRSLLWRRRELAIDILLSRVKNHTPISRFTLLWWTIRIKTKLIGSRGTDKNRGEKANRFDHVFPKLQKSNSSKIQSRAKNQSKRSQERISPWTLLCTNPSTTLYKDPTRVITGTPVQTWRDSSTRWSKQRT